MFVIKHVLNLRPLHTFEEEFKDGARDSVRETAIYCAALIAKYAPYRSGALSESVYIVDKNHSTEFNYARAVRKLQTEHPLLQPLPEIGSTNSDFLSKIGIAAPYWEEVEFGTRHMAAQPFVQPALTRAMGFYKKQMAQRLGEAIKKSDMGL